MPVRDFVYGAWVVWALFWLIAAFGAKPGSGRRLRPPFLVVAIGVVLLRVFHAPALTVQPLGLRIAGLVLVALGLALTVWARIYLGRNWGMPMTRKDEPELVTSGPYRFVRHPIYSGLLLAFLGTALATTIYWLIALAVMVVYFVHSAKVEERLMMTEFPSTYPSYRAKTKMMIPFVL